MFNYKLIYTICLLNLIVDKLKAIFTIIYYWFNNINTFYTKGVFLLCIGWATNATKSTRSCWFCEECNWDEPLMNKLNLYYVALGFSSNKLEISFFVFQMYSSYFHFSEAWFHFISKCNNFPLIKETNFINDHDSCFTFECLQITLETHY